MSAQESPSKGRVVVVNFVSLDGVIQSPLFPDEDRDGGFAHGGWVSPYGDDTMAAFMRKATIEAAGMLLGRRSYEIFTGVWSNADESGPGGDAIAAMNRMPKYVVTRSQIPLPWNNSHRIDGELPAGIEELKQKAEGDLVVFGSGVLIQALARHDLIDEYRLLLFPLVIGTGKRMFPDDGQLARFTHTSTTTSAQGVVMLTYTRI